jgi:hypothetical protein
MPHAEKLNEEDDGFLEAPDGALLLGQGVDGVETWIERDRTATVRIVVATVASVISGPATLDAVIETGGATARAQDGPRGADDHRHLQAVVSVQAVVREGERLSFKAYPRVQGARVLRTVVYTTEVGKPAS